jgi:hypothetical protein
MRRDLRVAQVRSLHHPPPPTEIIVVFAIRRQLSILLSIPATRGGTTTPCDPDERSDDEWGTGFAAGCLFALVLCVVVYALVVWLGS